MTGTANATIASATSAHNTSPKSDGSHANKDGSGGEGDGGGGGDNGGDGGGETASGGLASNYYFFKSTSAEEAVKYRPTLV
jgi:hypothetical protein